jgi:hypothetical protein
MKLLEKNPIPLRANRVAFTLPEILITSTIFITFLTLGMVTLQLYGIRSYQLSATKLTSMADSLKTLSQFRNQILGAAALNVGNFTSNNSTFVPAASGSNQIGNAVQVFPGTNTASYLVFYRNTDAANCPNLYLYDTNGATLLLARRVANTNCFQAEDQNGNVLTNTQNQAAIHMTLQFYQNQYVFAGNPTNYYYLDTRSTPRAPNLN